MCKLCLISNNKITLSHQRKLVANFQAAVFLYFNNHLIYKYTIAINNKKVITLVHKIIIQSKLSRFKIR